MNKKFLVMMMAIVVGSMTFTGCANKKEVVTDTVVVEENVVDEEMAQEVVEETPVVEDEMNYGEQDPTASQEMFFVITDGIELPSSMDMESEMFQDSYGIDTNVLESYVVRMPMMNVHASEIAIFELKDASDVETVKAGIAKRQEALETQWASYLPAQYELVQNYQVVEKGNFVLFVISEQADEIVANFEAAVS